MAKARKPEDITKWFRGKVKQNDDAVNGLLHMAADIGVEMVQNNIATRGAENGSWDESWDHMRNAAPGRYESTPGRVAKGAMIDAVDSWVSIGGKDNKSRMAFGWTNPSQRRDYFKYQEGGFEHVGFVGVGTKQIEGMHAISDAAQEVFDWLDDEIGKALK